MTEKTNFIFQIDKLQNASIIIIIIFFDYIWTLSALYPSEAWQYKKWGSNKAVFRNLLSSTTHSGLSDSAPPNVTSQKGGINLYMTLNIYLHINTCSIRMNACEKKTLYRLNKTFSDEE